MIFPAYHCYMGYLCTFRNDISPFSIAFHREKAKRCLKLLNKFYEIFKEDSMVITNSGVQELKVEYFILSLYLLLRHIDTYYVFGKDEYPLFRKFVSDFYQRWKKDDPEDTNSIWFRENRRQTKENSEEALFYRQTPLSNLFLLLC